MVNISEYMARATIDLEKPTEVDLKCKFIKDNDGYWHMKIYMKLPCIWKCVKDKFILDSDYYRENGTNLLRNWIYDIWNGKNGNPTVKKLIIYS